MMKIVRSIKDCYEEQKEMYKKLEKKIKDVLTNPDVLDQKWFYLGRVKEEVSYALKVESGDVDPYNLEDFFACTIVVENHSQIKKAITKIEKYCNIKCTEPEEGLTTNDPDSFIFDDLRLHATLKPRSNLPKDYEYNQLSELTFEIQIKTFLQHVWGIATHDLTYKGSKFNWATDRVGFQIKAMLEHAEISISEIEKIKDTEILNNKHKRTRRLKEIADFLTEKWSDRLPEHTRTLAINVDRLLQQLGIDLKELKKLLSEESKIEKGEKTINLSPYFAIIQTIINQSPNSIRDFVNSNRSDFKIPITGEIDQKGLFTSNYQNILRIGC